MEDKHYSLGKAARIFAGSAQEYYQISFNASEIILSNDYFHAEYPYQNIVGNISINKGLIWAALEWKLNNDALIKFDWINKQSARQLQVEINQRIEDYYKKYFKQCSQQIIVVFHQLEGFYKQDRYLRYTSAQEWL